MNEFVHIKSVIGIVLGLSLTHLIKGSVVYIQHPDRRKFSTLHFLWVFYVFLLIIHFWWWEINLKLITHWTFGDYAFIISYILLYYLLCAILYPDDIKDYLDYEDYFLSRKVWFFSILALCYLADIIDTYIKGSDYLLGSQPEYYPRIFIHVAFCGVAVAVKNNLFQKILVIAMILYEISFILRYFSVE